jgi:oligopeptide transport system permease protein
MGRYVLRRLLQMIPVFIGTTFLIFYMVYSLGDPIAALFQGKAVDPAVANQLRHSLWLDRPLWEQYLHYMAGIFQGNFGTSFNGTPVTTLMFSAFPTTLKLTTVAFLFEMIVGIVLGVASGMRRGGFTDTFVLLFTLFIISIPIFVIGFVVQYLLGVKWHIINPSVAYGAPWSQLIVPGLVLASTSLAYVARLTRTTVAENARADYVRTAVAKGLPQHRVVIHHLLRNSLIPVVTFLGTDLGALMGGALITENIFNIQGVGYNLYQGIQQQNTDTVVGFVTILVIIYLVANLLVDLLYAVLDPRIRYV